MIDLGFSGKILAYLDNNDLSCHSKYGMTGQIFNISPGILFETVHTNGKLLIKDLKNTDLRHHTHQYTKQRKN